MYVVVDLLMAPEASGFPERQDRGTERQQPEEASHGAFLAFLRPSAERVILTLERSAGLRVSS